MKQFSIVDGLNEIFDVNTIKQIISDLIRYPFLWGFISRADNFYELKIFLGDDPLNWTAEKIVIGAAGFLDKKGIYNQRKENLNGKQVFELVNEKTSFVQISEILIRINDYLEKISFFKLIEDIARNAELNGSTINKWSLIFSLIFKSSNKKLEFLAAFSDVSDDKKLEILADILYASHEVCEFFIEHFNELLTIDGLNWFATLNNNLNQRGDGSLAKKLVNQLLINENVFIEKPRIEELSIQDLLKLLERDHFLLSLIKISDNDEKRILIENQIKQLIIEVNKQYQYIGEFVTDPNESFRNVPYCKCSLEKENLAVSKLNLANSIVASDPKSARLIFKEALLILENKPVKLQLLDLIISDDNEIFGNLIYCEDLIRDISKFLNELLDRDPGNPAYLKFSALFHHKHGDHNSAIRSFEILEIISNLSRKEKIQYAKSLEYLNDWKTALRIRKEINYIGINEVKELFYCAYWAGESDFLNVLIKENLFGIRDELIVRAVINESGNNKDPGSERSLDQFWPKLKSDAEKTIFIDFLKYSGEVELAYKLMKHDSENNTHFSQTRLLFISELIHRNAFDEVSEILDNIDFTENLDQYSFEEIIDHFLEFDLKDKASSFLKHYSTSWQLSPRKNFQRARLALQLGNYSRAEEIFNNEISKCDFDEQSKTSYALACLNADPKSFPIGLKQSKVSENSRKINELFRSENSNNLIIKLLLILCQENKRIPLLEDLIVNSSLTPLKDSWRIKAALGNEYYEQGIFDKAIIIYKELERIKPFNIDLLIRLLYSYSKLKLWEEAEVILHRLLSIENLDFSKFLIDIQDLFLTSESLDFLSNQYKWVPDCIEILVLYAMALVRNNQNKEALEILQELVSRAGLSKDHQLIASHLLFLAGEPRLGKNILDILFSDIQPKTNDDYLYASLIYEESGYFEQAIMMLNHIYPADYRLVGLKAEILGKMGKLDEGLEILSDTSLQLSEQELSNLKPILPTIEKWGRISNSMSYFYETAAILCYLGGSFEKSISFIQNGLEKDPENKNLIGLSLEINKLLLNHKIIGEILEKYSEIGLGSIDLICSFGEAALELNHEILAAKYISNGIKIDPENIRLKALQSRMILRNGNKSEAQKIFDEANQYLAIFETVSEISPKKGLFDDRVWLAQSAYDLGDYSTAEKIYKNAILQKGYFPYYEKYYLNSILPILRENFLIGELMAHSQVVPIEEDDRMIINHIVEEETYNSNCSGLAFTCRAYLTKSQSDMGVILRDNNASDDLRDRIFASFFQNGARKTEIDFLASLKNNDQKLFLSVLLMNDQPEAIFEFLQKENVLDTKDVKHLALLAFIQEKLGNLEEAYSAISLALNIWPEEYYWESFAGRICKKMGDLANAAIHMEKAEMLKGNLKINKDVNSLENLEVSEDMILLLEQKMAENPYDFDLLMKIGMLYYKFNKPSKAVNYLNKARKADRSRLDPLLILGHIAKNLGNLTRAEEYVDLALTNVPDQKEFIILKVELLNKKHGAAVAIKYLQEKMVGVNEGMPDLRAVMADLIYEEEGIYKTLEFFESIKDDQKISLSFSNARIKYFYLSGSLERAMNFGEQALINNLVNSESFSLLGKISRDQGNLDKAIDFYYQAIKLNPYCVVNFVELSEIYINRREFDLSIQILDKGIDLNPSNIDLLMRSGKIYFEKGSYEKARNRINKILDFEPDNKEAMSLINLLDNAIIHENLITVK